MAKVKTIRPVTLDDEAKAAKLAKKSGRRGIGPALDPVEDFENPTMKVTSESGVQIIEEDFLTDGPGDPQEAQVQNGLVLMQFVRVKPIKEKDGKRFLALEFAVGLTDESSKLLGEEVRHGYKLLEDGVTGLTLDLAAHVIDVAIAADMKPVIHSSVTPSRCNLQNVQEKGSGEERTIIRLSFVAPVPQTPELAVRVCENHGALVWLKMAEAQGRLVR